MRSLPGRGGDQSNMQARWRLVQSKSLLDGLLGPGGLVRFPESLAIAFGQVFYRFPQR